MKLYLLSLLGLYCTAIMAQPQDVSVVFHNPATHFTESAPIGNGRIGAMLYGGTSTDRIVLNEISLWSGGAQESDEPQAYEYLPHIQQLLLERKNIEAEGLLQQHFIAKGEGSCRGNGANCSYGCYQIFGDLLIKWKDTSPVQNYSRILRLDEATAVTTYQRNGNTITQTAFADFKNDIIWVKISAQKPFEVAVSLTRKENATLSYLPDRIILTGVLPNKEHQGMHFAGIVTLESDGKMQKDEAAITVQNARELLLKVSMSTNYNYTNSGLTAVSPLETAKAYLQTANSDFESALAKSKSAYQELFNRNRWYAKANADTQSLSTLQRLENFSKGKKDALLPILYYNFGRYLLICSSREGLLPANLQGLWAEEYQTPWNGDYHLNINLQMNYWLAEISNLSNLTEPLHRFTKNLMPNGRKTAKSYYKAEGWVAHVISNPWFFTSPGESAVWGSTLTGGAWLCQHIWQHYLFTHDLDFLKNYYPVMKEATAFFQSFLIKDPTTGYWVTAPSNSPENAYLFPTDSGKKIAAHTCIAPTMDMQIVRELLNNTIKAATILKVDDEKITEWKKIVENTPPNRIGKKGDLNEWLDDWQDAEPTHRHVSHLYGLYPYDEITPWDTPLLAKAAKKTLKIRGNEGTGWSSAWKINFWARLQNGKQALLLLHQLLKPVSPQKLNGEAGGTYPNLFCAHPPFQIDGNLGGAAGIAEMLLQSHGTDNTIRFLPALPHHPDWENGTISGMKARNGFQVSFSWEKHQLQQATITSLQGAKCHLLLPAGKALYHNNKCLIKASKKAQKVSFDTEVSASYYIK